MSTRLYKSNLNDEMIKDIVNKNYQFTLHTSENNNKYNTTHMNDNKIKVFPAM